MANIPHDQMIFLLTLVATLWQLKNLALLRYATCREPQGRAIGMVQQENGRKKYCDSNKL